MDPRRASSRTVIDPKVRQVGFFTPGAPPEQTPTTLTTTTTTLASPVVSPAGNSLSPVMIPPPTNFSDNNNNSNSYSLGGIGVGVESVAVGSSYNPASEFSGSKGECSGKVVASSLPVGGFEMAQKNYKGSGAVVVASSLTTVSMLSGSTNLIGELPTFVCFFVICVFYANIVLFVWLFGSGNYFPVFFGVSKFFHIVLQF